MNNVFISSLIQSSWKSHSEAYYSSMKNKIGFEWPTNSIGFVGTPNKKQTFTELQPWQVGSPEEFKRDIKYTNTFKKQNTYYHIDNDTYKIRPFGECSIHIGYIENISEIRYFYSLRNSLVTNQWSLYCTFSLNKHYSHIVYYMYSIIETKKSNRNPSNNVNSLYTFLRRSNRHFNVSNKRKNYINFFNDIIIKNRKTQTKQYKLSPIINHWKVNHLINFYQPKSVDFIINKKHHV